VVDFYRLSCGLGHPGLRRSLSAADRQD
jgi:hypothetical protein